MMMTKDLDHHAQFYCSQLSKERAEPLIGTAGRTDFYVLIEHRGKWGLRAFEESDLPARRSKAGQFTGSHVLRSTLQVAEYYLRRETGGWDWRTLYWRE